MELIGTADEPARIESEPMYWHNKASDLHGSAGALTFCMDNQQDLSIPSKLELGDGYDMIAGTYGVYRMLCGMSLELAYKAIIVAKGEKIPTTHNLITLAEKADIDPTKEEVALLAILTECIVWEGRYPTPKAKDHELMEYFAWLSYENLFTKETMGKNKYFLKPKDPNPLGWEEYNKLWKRANDVFWFFHS